jgi:hypothetical protein
MGRADPWAPFARRFWKELINRRVRVETQHFDPCQSGTLNLSVIGSVIEWVDRRCQADCPCGECYGGIEGVGALAKSQKSLYQKGKNTFPKGVFALPKGQFPRYKGFLLIQSRVVS